MARGGTLGRYRTFHRRDGIGEVLEKVERRDDVALMRAVQAEETDAFEEFVRRYQKRFYRIAMGYMRDHDDALDAVQGAFIRIYKARDRWTPQAQPFTWSYRILVNHCIDLIRKQRIREASSLDGPQMVEKDLEDRASVSPFDSSAGHQLGEVIRAAVADLPDRQREIFTLRHFEEMSLQEIAEVQGCALGTVKSSLHRAVMTLRDRLSEFFPETAHGLSNRSS
jgi:RNA polymerase sigma-70 factor (ECF subfamily)